MNKVILLMIFLFCPSFANATTKLIAVDGGIAAYGSLWTFLPNNESGLYYPLVENYPTEDIDAIAQVSGLDAIAKELQGEVSGSYEAVILYGATLPETIVDAVKNDYQSGDSFHLVGYSAGTGVVLKAVHLLAEQGYQIDTLSLIDAYSLETNDIPVITGGTVLVGEWVGNIDYEIPDNIKNVQVYYQDTSFFGVEGNHFAGHSAFVAEDPSKTTISTFYINDVTHSSIDNDHRVWRGIVIAIKRSLSGNISLSSEKLDICTEFANGDLVYIAEELRQEYDCAAREESIEGSIAYDTFTGTLVFTPHHDDLGSVTITVATGLQIMPSVWVPTFCHLSHEELEVSNYQTDERYDIGSRMIPQSTTIEIKERFTQTGSDALNCRNHEGLKTVETGFYKQVGDGPWIRLRGQDGERFQKTKMSNLNRGHTHTEKVIYTVQEGPGTVLTLWSCLDENNDLNQLNPDACEDEVFTVTAPPEYNIAVSGVGSGSNQAGLEWSLPVTISNLGADLSVSIKLLVMLGDRRLPNLKVEHWDMGSGGSKTYTIKGIETNPGTYPLSVCFQGNNAFKETSTADNCDEGTLTVSPPPPSPKRPFGNIERMSCSGFKGWIRDQSSTARRIEIYRNSTRQFSLRANKYRSDVRKRWGGNGQAGYELAFPWNLKNGSTHTWKVYAIDDGVGGTTLSKTLIGSKRFRCNNAAPTGRLEHATRTSVHGWAWDPDRPNNPINIHVYTEAGYRGGGNAPWWRGDLPGNRQHAFNINVDNLCWRITDGWANVRVAYLDALTGRRWSNTLNLPCN